MSNRKLIDWILEDSAPYAKDIREFELMGVLQQAADALEALELNYDMEAAPKDGRWIVAYAGWDDGGDDSICIIRWHGNHWQSSSEDFIDITPFTAWRITDITDGDQ